MTNTLTAPAAPIALAELTWEGAIELGAIARQAGDQARWDLGDIGAIVAHKWQRDSVKKFAGQIGLDNHKRLYEYMSVSEFIPKSARGGFPTLSWSHWREVSRHSLTLEQALSYMAEASDKNWPVAALREAITGNPDEPITRRKSFECDVADYDVAGKSVQVKLNYLDITDFADMMDRDSVTIELRVSWQEAR